MSKVEARKRRSQLFDEEKRRQRSELGRIDKIEVTYKSVEEDVVMMMNRDISTPYDCARHISENVAKTAAIALVDGRIWDMHRPFTGDCELNLVTMQSPKTGAVNYAFWRTCSLILGAVAESAFKDHVDVHLHSFPVPAIHSGSFTYDVFIDLPDWRPTDSELRAMSALFIKLTSQELPLERLEVPSGVALDIFQVDMKWKRVYFSMFYKVIENIISCFYIFFRIIPSSLSRYLISPRTATTIEWRCIVWEITWTSVEVLWWVTAVWWDASPYRPCTNSRMGPWMDCIVSRASPCPKVFCSITSPFLSWRNAPRNLTPSCGSLISRVRRSMWQRRWTK